MARHVRRGAVGIEGIVAKGLAQPYRGGARDWLKYRYRDSVDVIVGAVTGTLAHPNDSSSASTTTACCRSWAAPRPSRSQQACWRRCSRRR